MNRIERLKEDKKDIIESTLIIVKKLKIAEAEVDRLTKEKKELVDALQICLSVKSHKTSIEAMKELIRALLTRIK